MAFIDEVEISVRGGDGGNGCISFRREKYIPFGGPNGGNGGRGGSVILRSTTEKGSLLDFKYQPKFEGERGEHGMGSDCDGRSGKDRILAVPVGTLVYDQASSSLLADLSRPGMEFIASKGGKGGRGNKSFVSSTNRAPRKATPGEKGEAFLLKLELKLVADIGLIGLPNAGKSSFLRRISRATPKVADYPFTTLEPALGVVDHKDRTMVVADLPGLIEGASEGAGLGTRFLRHTTRSRILLHLVECTPGPIEIRKNLELVRKELLLYSPHLSSREGSVVLTKIDLLTPGELLTLKEEFGNSAFFISNHTGQGIEALLDYLARSSHQFSLETQWEEAPHLIEPEIEPEHNAAHLI